MKKIIERILEENTVPRRSLHGPAHWERVASYGRLIASRERVNERILVLFAYFHDCMRRSDGGDPEHGPRAAAYLERFPRELLDLSDGDRARLIFACRHHTYEIPTEDRTVRACWDADRLDLGRVDIRPDPDRLFTETAKRIARGRIEP